MREVVTVTVQQALFAAVCCSVLVAGDRRSRIGVKRRAIKIALLTHLRRSAFPLGAAALLTAVAVFPGRSFAAFGMGNIGGKVYVFCVFVSVSVCVCVCVQKSCRALAGAGILR